MNLYWTLAELRLSSTADSRGGIYVQEVSMRKVGVLCVTILLTLTCPLGATGISYEREKE